MTTATILAFLPAQASFDPDEVRAMSAAFDEVCESLKLNGDLKARETIATRVIELARRGERNAGRLRDRVLREAHSGSESSGVEQQPTAPDLPESDWHEAEIEPKARNAGF